MNAGVPLKEYYRPMIDGGPPLRAALEEVTTWLQRRIGRCLNGTLLYENEAAERKMIDRRLRQGASGRRAMSGFTNLSLFTTSATKLRH